MTPTFLIQNTQPSASYVVVPVRTNNSRRFFLRFCTPVLLLKRRSSHSVAVIDHSFSWLFPKIRRIRRLLFSCHRSPCCCVPVFFFVQWQLLRRFWRHITHRSLCFVFAVLLSSFTPATVSQFRRISTSLTSPFALFRACCVVVEFHSSHSFAPYFRKLRKFDRFWHHLQHCSLCVSLSVLLSSLTPATVAIPPTG